MIKFIKTIDPDNGFSSFCNAICSCKKYLIILTSFNYGKRTYRGKKNRAFAGSF